MELWLSFCFLFKTLKALFHCFLAAVVSDLKKKKKPNLGHGSPMRNVHFLSGCSEYFFFIFGFQQFSYVIRGDSFCTQASCGFWNFLVL